MDNIVAALNLQYQFDFPSAEERQRNAKVYDEKHLSNHLERQNAVTGPLLKMPPELLDKILDYVFKDQVVRVSVIDGKAKVASTSARQLVSIPYVCRQLRQIITPLVFSRVTVQIVTFKFVSLFETWRITIHSDIGRFRAFLTSIPDAFTQRIQVAGVLKGAIGDEQMGLYKVCGFKSAGLASVDCDELIESYIRQVYPVAEITCIEVKDIGLL